MSDVVRGYKGFDRNLRCRDMQFEVGKTFEVASAELCRSGLHFCEHPLDCFGYYPPGMGSRYCLVEASGDVVGPDKGDTKRAATRLKIVREVTIAEMTAAAVKMAVDVEERSRKNRGAATASGDRGAATASGYRGAATASGGRGAATASGDSGAATASGYRGAATASGASGAATASGYRGAATASGKSSAAMASGRFGKARGAIGCALFLVERDDLWKIVAAKAAIVDGETIKADTWYTVRGGEIVEVGDE